MTTASPGWTAGTTYAPPARPRGSRRAVEIVAVVFAFLWFWPLAVAYVAWKLLGYPVPVELRRRYEQGFTNLFGDARFEPAGRAWRAASCRSTGNAAFDEYRRSEIERLEAERRKLDEEAREFRAFVDDLKRAKDREEFDAYMARRRAERDATTA